MKTLKVLMAVATIGAMSSISFARGQEGYGIRYGMKTELSCEGLKAANGNGGIVAGALSPDIVSDAQNNLYVTRGALVLGGGAGPFYVPVTFVKKVSVATGISTEIYRSKDKTIVVNIMMNAEGDIVSGGVKEGILSANCYVPKN